MNRAVHLEAFLYLAAAGLGLGLAYYVVSKGKTLAGAAAAVADAVNPASENNVVNKAANSVFQAVTGNNVDSIGTWLAGKLSPAVRAADAAISAPTKLGAAMTLGSEFGVQGNLGLVLQPDGPPALTPETSIIFGGGA